MKQTNRRMETAGSMTHAAACAPHKIYIYIKPEIDVMHMNSVPIICAASKASYDIGSSTSPNHQSGGIQSGGPGVAGGKRWQPVGSDIWEEDSI
ncbi:hypothetical protein PRBRB14_25380 [Hallella multisaccharivorax DSM 17128]|uniref:Uncharacterized protein n=1 Tax=Hallella multisaccharivorax DSM 17128 TaxID=688246 RepID=F8N9E5_9BACT|nr:hypothetical protein [Hallella multisaccharivorax]EGN55659.1 hypothetical protein Premu_0173 [Hallella multisaccharivorax DSM 17128]GJG31659.1 hypothetical protein PRBRB14_25380 [Hallella multisaccharivorax DSM 17128]